MAQPKTKKPSGVSIVRDGANFITKWKITDEDYGDGQIFQYYDKLRKNKWVSSDLWSRAVSKKVVIDTTKYYPNTTKKLTFFRARIRGNRAAYSVENYKTHRTTRYDPTVSDWADKTYEILPPDKPGLTATLSSTYSHVTDFVWILNTTRSSRKWCSDLQFQTILVKESSGSGPDQDWKTSALGWETGIVGVDSHKVITEDTALLADASYTRWFRIRSRGPAGASEWRYASHVYAKPYQAKIYSATLTDTNSGGYMCRVEWEAQKNSAHPIDRVTVEYAFAVPVAGMNCPTSPGWQTADVVADTAGNDAVSFSIGAVVEEDQCLFVRVNTTHDRQTTEGVPKMVTAGPLRDPSGLVVSLDGTTRLARVDADNDSQNPDAYIAVVYSTSDDPDGYICGIIPREDGYTTVKVPEAVAGQEVVFGVYTVVGEYEAISRADEVTRFAINEIIRSANIVQSGGDIPLAPSNVSLSMTDIPGTIRVTWNWSWLTATAAELSWADHADAWESTAGPTTYVINNTHAAAWNISGLAVGKRWYVRVRLTSGSGDGKTYGAYSDIAAIDLSSAPSIPVLTLSDSVITEDGSVTASWSYSSTDGSEQAFAEIAEVTTNGATVTFTPIASTQSAMHLTINAAEVGWQSGETHALVVRVVSASGRRSDGWSDPVFVSIADPLSIAITQTSLEEITVTEDSTTRTVTALTEMPLTITVTGAGAGGTTSVIIERADAYQVDRPDETQFRGYEGETIAYLSYMGEGQATIDAETLVGSLDDEASYRIIATVQDGLGQSAEIVQEFEVHWTHQAAMPAAAVTIDETNLVAIITPTAEDPEEGDTCDIYRLSVDKPELIYPDATFGTKYVDPFPAIGEYGGHRVVYKTANGDYITADNELAWIDLREADGDSLETDYTVIDFGTGRILINRNLDISNTWTKDFEETKYLGGSVQGDWNPAVSRKATVATVAVSILDQETIQAMRRLAVYAGICHVRTSDGSSYAANVDVSDSYDHKNGRNVISYELEINRVDPEGYDGMPLADWSATHADGYSSAVGTGVVGTMLVGG